MLIYLAKHINQDDQEKRRTESKVYQERTENEDMDEFQEYYTYSIKTKKNRFRKKVTNKIIHALKRKNI